MRSSSLRVIVMVLLVAFSWTSDAVAQRQSSAEATFLDRVMTVYITKGLDAFVAMVGIPGMEKMASLQAAGFRQVETIYGKPISYSVIKTIGVGKSTTIITFVLEYERGPSFGVAIAYHQGGRASLPFIKFHTDPLKIFPDSLLFGR